jgi:hypothetical protein
MEVLVHFDLTRMALFHLDGHTLYLQVMVQYYSITTKQAILKRELLTEQDLLEQLTGQI